jgi:hypothetical protein
VIAGDAAELGQCPSSVVGQRDRVIAAIVRVTVTGDEASVLKLVDQGDQSRGVHAQRVGEIALAPSGELPEAAEHPGLRRRELQPSDALGECGGGVCSELGEQEGHAALDRRLSVVGRTRGHATTGYTHSVIITCNNSYC